MADALGMHGYGTTLWYGADNAANPGGVSLLEQNGVYERLQEVISLSGLSASNTVVEVTHLMSDGFAKEKIPGFQDGGQVTFRFNYTAALLLALNSIRPAPDRAYPDWGRLRFVMQFPDGGQWWFRGFIQGSPFTVEEDNRITIETTIEISGIPVFTLPV